MILRRWTVQISHTIKTTKIQSIPIQLYILTPPDNGYTFLRHIITLYSLPTSVYLHIDTKLHPPGTYHLL